MLQTIERKKALELLQKFIAGEIDGKDVLPNWPLGTDSLLDSILNIFIEPVDDGGFISCRDIASLGIQAIENNWDDETFGNHLDALDTERRSNRQKGK